MMTAFTGVPETLPKVPEQLSQKSSSFSHSRVPFNIHVASLSHMTSSWERKMGLLFLSYFDYCLLLRSQDRVFIFKSQCGRDGYMKNVRRKKVEGRNMDVG